MYEPISYSHLLYPQLLIYSVKMMKKTATLIQCQNCHRNIERRKASLHKMMCSTIHLRQSQVMLKEKEDKKMQKCKFCQALVEPKDFDFHVSLQCKHRLVPCIDCDDMFPLSLFNQHLEVCRARKKMEKEESSKSSALGTILTGLSYLGATLYNKGAEAAVYCGKFIEQNRSPVLLYLEYARAKIQDTFEDLFLSLAYQQNIEGMPREQIRRIELTNYRRKGTEDQTCTICICELQEQQPIKELKCKHVFHPVCIDKWLRINRTCPLCKRDQLA